MFSTRDIGWQDTCGCPASQPAFLGPLPWGGAHPCVPPPPLRLSPCHTALLLVILLHCSPAQQAIANRDSRQLVVELDDVADYLTSSHGGDTSLVEAMSSNTMRYVALLADAADSVMPSPSDTANLKQDVFDVMVSTVGEGWKQGGER